MLQLVTQWYIAFTFLKTNLILRWTLYCTILQLIPQFAVHHRKMCRRVSCTQCGKPTWTGCGQHIEQVSSCVLLFGMNSQREGRFAVCQTGWHLASADR
jgi:hypothetical protein